jgi:hypothetical protein
VATLEVVYTGTLDDEIDAWLSKRVGKISSSSSYNSATRARNIQWKMRSTAEANEAAAKIRFGGRIYTLDIFVRS